MSPHRLVLASASPARLRLLTAAGFRPDVVVSGIDETSVTAPTTEALVGELARRKAAAAASRLRDGLVVGCDSLLDVDGMAHGKPASRAEALARWEVLRGREAQLHTGHCVIDAASGATAAGVATTTVRFGRPTDEELRAYVTTGEPLEVAGGFTLDGRSAPFIEGVDGDPGNVIGLSLPLLRRLLADLGVQITELWA